jgi:transcriptional regulator NrdR family protein
MAATFVTIEVGMMYCEKCAGKTKVVDSRPERIMEHQAVNRRRVCKDCGYKFSTKERIVVGSGVVQPRKDNPAGDTLRGESGVLG